MIYTREAAAPGVDPIYHERRHYQSAPCPTCGESLDFSTDGNGRLVQQCPVCDWGWRKSRDYAAYQKRVQVAPAEDYPRKPCTYNADGQLQRTCRCGVTFTVESTNHRYCSDTCKRAGENERQRRERERWAVEGRCTQCGHDVMEKGKRTCAKCLSRARRSGRGSEALRRYWANKGAA